MTGFDFLFLAVFPYLAVVLAVGGGLYRFYGDRFSYSAFSSQFLENRTLFWGSVPWHFGILIILLAHVLAFLLPGPWDRLLSWGNALYVLEVIGLALAVAALVGIVALLLRRMINARVRATSTVMDWVLLGALVIQTGSGFWVSLGYRWGADWFMDTSVPWMMSLITLQPQIDYVATLPFIVKLHIIGGFVVIALFPFTRLVHVVSLPLSYLWRSYQVVIWNRPPTAPGRLPFQTSSSAAPPVQQASTSRTEAILFVLLMAGSFIAILSLVILLG